MTERHTLSQVIAILREVLDVSDLPITADTVAADVPGWDSMRYIEVVLAVERRFGIRLRSRDIDEIRDVGGLARAVNERLARG